MLRLRLIVSVLMILAVTGAILWLKVFQPDSRTASPSPLPTETPVEAPLAQTVPEPESAPTPATPNAASLQWERTVGEGSENALNRLLAVDNEGVLLAGRTTIKGGGRGDIWVLSLTKDGNKRWEKTYGGAGFETIYDGVRVSDSRYLLVGTSESKGSGKTDGWVVMVDERGRVQWQRLYGGRDQDYLNTALILPDGYLLVGSTLSAGSATRDGWLLRTDKKGEVRWQKTYGGDEFMNFTHGFAENEDHYIVIGHGQKAASRNMDGLVVGLNGKGVKQWQHYHGGAGEENFQHGIAVDGGYVLAGHTGSRGQGDLDGWLVKINGQGRLIWQKTYGDRHRDTLHRIIQTADGFYVLIGDMTRRGHSMDGWVVMTTDQGDPLWNQVYGTDRADWFRSADVYQDGLYLIGTTQLKKPGQTQGWLVKLQLQ